MNTHVMERPPLVSIIGTVAGLTPAPAPNRSGKIKLDDGKILSAFPDKLAMVEFGAAYDFGCTETVKNGVVYRDVKAIRPADVVPTAFRAPPAARQQQQQIRTASQMHDSTAATPRPASIEGNMLDFNRPTHPRDSERMFVCSILNAMIGTGRVENDVDVMIDAVGKLRQVWRETFGNDPV